MRDLFLKNLQFLSQIDSLMYGDGSLVAYSYFRIAFLDGNPNAYLSESLSWVLHDECEILMEQIVDF
jgi:hypothetical protein